MNIKKRAGLPRMTLHVMNRGARKVSIFGGDPDRKTFVGLLGRCAMKYGVTINAWCLMPNHYHLESDSEGDPLWHMMRDLDGSYARAFNQRHDTSGCLFQGPFKSMSIDDPEGVAYVSRYIHTNSVDLGAAPQHYRWSSCRAFLGLEPVPEWLDPTPVLRVVKQPKASGVESYRRYLDAAPTREKKGRRRMDPADQFHAEWLRFLEESVSERVIGHEAALGRIALSTVVTWAACRRYHVPADTVAAYFGYQSPETARSIANRFQRHLDEDPELAELMEVFMFLRRRNVNT